MKITNTKQSTRTLMAFSITWMVLIIAFAITFLDFFDSPIWFRIALALVLAVMAIGFYIGGFHYVLANIENEVLEIKYYNLFPAGRKFQAVQIPLKQYHHYEINHQVGGFVRWLILFRNLKGGIAKYPPIGLSALDKSTRSELEKMLNQIKES